jgi:hypothetical protein
VTTELQRDYLRLRKTQTREGGEDFVVMGCVICATVHIKMRKLKQIYGVVMLHT